MASRASSPAKRPVAPIRMPTCRRDALRGYFPRNHGRDRTGARGAHLIVADVREVPHNNHFRHRLGRRLPLAAVRWRLMHGVRDRADVALHPGGLPACPVLVIAAENAPLPELLGHKAADDEDMSVVRQRIAGGKVVSQPADAGAFDVLVPLRLGALRLELHGRQHTFSAGALTALTGRRLPGLLSLMDS